MNSTGLITLIPGYISTADTPQIRLDLAIDSPLSCLTACLSGYCDTSLTVRTTRLRVNNRVGVSGAAIPVRIVIYRVTCGQQVIKVVRVIFKRTTNASWLET